jgi:hypothetical protein
MFNALQQLQLLASDNSGIYQYDFLNTLLFNNSTEINKLDELTFRSVNNSKEDDGLEGAALIGENSPAVEVRSNDGTLLWTIPALLDEHLLNYDITFMVKQFLRSVVLYCNDQGFTEEEIGMFMTGRVWIGENFMTTYGINPIMSYIKAKYRDFDERVLNKAYQDVRDTMGSLIEKTIKEFPRVSDAQPSAAASSGQSSLGQPLSSLQPTQRTPLLQGTTTGLNPTPSASFGQPFSSSFGQPFSSSSGQSSSSSGQAAEPFKFTFGTTYNINRTTGRMSQKASRRKANQISEPTRVQPIEPAQPTGTGKFISKTKVQPTGSRPFAVPVHGIFNSKQQQEPTRVQPIGLAQGVQQPTGSRPFAVPVHGIFNSKQQQNSNNAKQRNAKRSKKTLFATTGTVTTPGGGKHRTHKKCHTKKTRRTQKNHKRKKHGTQRKRSH